MKNDCGNWFARNFPLLGATIITCLILYFTDQQQFIGFFKPFLDPLTDIVLLAFIGISYLAYWVVMNHDPLTGEYINERQ